MNSTPSLYKFFTFSSSLITFVSVLLSQFSLTLIPHYFPSSPLLLQLSLSALLLLIVTGLGNRCRRLIGFSVSAPAFVLFNILFIWGTHVLVIRKGVSWVWSIVFNAECVLLICGLYSILSSDPGLVAEGGTSLKGVIQDEGSGIKTFTEEEGLLKLVACPVVNVEECSSIAPRVRYCKYCKAYIREFDHHCPAFGNCIGVKNHLLFMALLVGFVIVEASYTVCSTQYIDLSSSRDNDLLESKQSKLSMCLVISTRLFSFLQVMWQVLFLAWHIYCVCVNIKTDEWINWRKYPEFHDHIQLQPLHPNLVPRFRNPYNKGILRNIKEFLSPKG